MNNRIKQITYKYNSKFLFYGLLVYCLLYYIQPGGRFPALAPLRLEFVLGSILFVVIIYKILTGEIPINENKLHYATIVFFLICAINIPFAEVKSRALEQYISYTKFFSLYLMIISCIADEKRLKIYLSVYLCMISLIFVEPFLLSLKGEGFRYNNFMMRLYGVTDFFGHPNQLGGIVSANLPLFYFMIPFSKSKTVKVILISLILIGLRIIMLTQSRTAFIGVTAFCGILWILSKKKVVFGIAIILAAIVFWNLAPEQTRARFMTLRSATTVMSGSEEDFVRNDDLGSMSSRWILIKRSLTIFIENPIIGVGMNCFSSVSGRRWQSWYPTHCLYTQALSEIGLVGTIVFIYIIILIFKNISETKRILVATNDRSIIFFLNQALYVFLVIRLVIGLFGHDLYRSWWWFAAGLSIVNLRILKRKYSEQ